MDFSLYMNIKVKFEIKVLLLIDDNWFSLVNEGHTGGINSVNWAPSINPVNNNVRTTR